MSAPPSVPDTAIGLTQSELVILRQQQQLVNQQPGLRGAMPDRGRGTSRHSQPSSRAASAASSQSVTGRINLDPRNLQSLSAALDSLLNGIRGRIQQLEDATQQSVNASSSRANSTIQNADQEIRRMKAIITEIDRLEEECEKIKNIRNVVRQLKIRVDAASERFDKINQNHHPRPPVSVRPDTRRR